MTAKCEKRHNVRIAILSGEVGDVGESVVSASGLFNAD